MNRFFENEKFRFIAVVLVLIVLGGVVVTALMNDRWAQRPEWQITVSGRGIVEYDADVAKVNLGVQVSNVASADEALGTLNAAMGNVTTAIQSLSSTQAEIATQSYTLTPEYEYSPDGQGTPRVSGYTAGQQLIVTVRGENSQQAIQSVIEAASRAGANQILSVTFEPSNLEELKQQAIDEAIAEARKRAHESAQKADVRLGKITGWWETPVQVPGVPSPYEPYYGGYGVGGDAAMSKGSVIPTGGREIIYEVSVSFKVK